MKIPGIIKFRALKSSLLILCCAISTLSGQTIQTYYYTGGVQTFTVPSCINSLTLEVWGAQGGMDASGWPVNLGGYASAVFAVTPGQVFSIYVGGQATSILGGFNGGGNGFPSPSYGGGSGGGGASDIRFGGTTFNNRIIVAGGGGGGGSDAYGNWCIGGGGGGLVGNEGQCYDGGCAGSQPGTQSSSGPGICNGVLNVNQSGGFGYGGNGLPACGGGFGCGSSGGDTEPGYGGGGGWYGGSAGCSNFGGSGGSGYISPSATNGIFFTAVNGGNGRAQISYEIVMNLAVSSASCVPTGSASVLAAKGIAPYTYTWSGSAQTTSLVTGLAPGIHTVTVSDAGACRTRTTTVMIAAPLSLNAVSACFPVNNASVTALGGSAPYTYTWSGSVQTTSVATGLATGLHTLTVSDLNNCQTKTTTVEMAATISVTASSSSCVATGSANALVSGGLAPYSYTWTGSAQTTSLVTNLASGLHTITVSDANSCQTLTTSINVSTPSPIVVSNTALCIGYSAVMTANAATSSFTWSPGANLSTTSGSVVSANPLATTIYTISTTNSLNCVSSTTAQLYVVPTQTVPLISPTTCLGQNLNLIANSTYTGALYSWSGPGGYTSGLQNPVIPSSSFTNSGVYSITVVSAPGCTSSAVTSATVFAMPSPSITSNSPVCTNQSLTLNGSGATTYSWAGPSPNNFSSLSQNTVIVSTSTLDSGVYTLVGSFTTGCSVSVSSSLTVRPLPATGITHSNVVCVNGTLSLSGSGGSSYNWTGPNAFSSLAQNPVINNVQLAASGIYTLLATLNTCTASTTQSITVHSLPVPLATNNSSICETKSLQLNATGGTAFAWTGPAAFTSVLQNPSIATSSLANNGIYTVVVTDVNNCMATTSTTVSIVPNPTMSVVGSTVCLNEPGVLAVSGGTDCVWSGPSGFNSVSINPTITSVNNLTAGSYTAIVTAANTCTSIAVADVSFFPLPLLATTGATVCLNEPATLSVSGAATYTWTGPGAYLSTGSNAAVPAANLLSSGVYTVLGSSSNACTITSVASLTTLPLPAVTATGSIVCFKEKGFLFSTGSNDVVDYAWTGPLGYTSALQNPTLASAGSSVPVTYTVVVTAQNSCTFQAVATLSTHALPLVSATSTVICRKEPFTIVASGAVTYIWSGPLGTSNGPTVVLPNVNAGSVGVYTVIGTDVNTCSNSATASIDTLSLPPVTALGSTVCIGQLAVVKAFGASTYFWKGPGNYTSNLANASIASATSSVTQIYTVVGTAANTCTFAAFANLDTYPLPQPVITAPARVCFGSVIQLQGAGAKTYTWTGPMNYYLPGMNVTLPVYDNLQEGSYTLSVTDNLGCKNNTSTYIEIDPLPGGKLVSNNANNYCVPYCSEFRLQSLGTSTIISTRWLVNRDSTLTETFSLCVAKTGSTMVTGRFTDVVGCSASLNFVIPANPKPTADFVYMPEKPVEGIDIVSFNDNSTGEKLSNWNWYFVNNDGYSGSSANISYTFDDAGTYPIAFVVANAWGCADTVVKTITVDSDVMLFVPNAFTPNGDGLNDTFQPKGRGIVSYALTIYDRWGNQVFQTANFETGWNGQVRGTEIAGDVYAWKIRTVDVKGKINELTGQVTVVR